MRRTIPELLARVRRDLRVAGAVRVGLGLSADGPEAVAKGVEDWTLYAAELLRLAQNTTPAGWIVDGLNAAVANLSQLATEAQDLGLSNATGAINEIRARVVEATGDLARLARDLFTKFWGFAPEDPLKVVAGLVVFVLAGGLAIALSAGGQGAVLALGKGYGSSIGSLGAGGGKALGNVNLTALVRGG